MSPKYHYGLTWMVQTCDMIETEKEHAYVLLVDKLHIEKIISSKQRRK